ncbi:carboxypeptidase-like regulatory domain-containing protein [Pedobacter sp. PAMC26386]|nr:carboxypeptidase-like regulatory domain-containing protein [Pedobacter sp. PAMC26386]
MDKLYSYFLCISLCCFLSLNAIAQQKVTGTVRDIKGLPLPGVSVKIKDTKTGTFTNSNGQYSISSGTNNGTLIFSYVGFLPRELSINGKSSVNVTLDEDVKSKKLIVPNFPKKIKTKCTIFKGA